MTKGCVSMVNVASVVCGAPVAIGRRVGTTRMTAKKAIQGQRANRGTGETRRFYQADGIFGNFSPSAGAICTVADESAAAGSW